MASGTKVDNYIATYKDWRGTKLQELREIINTVDSKLSEDYKWGVPVWSKNGLVCAVSAFKDHVKINFFKGAYLSDPQKVFNSGLDSKEHRSINMGQTDIINKDVVRTLLVEAIAYNESQR